MVSRLKYTSDLRTKKEEAEIMKVNKFRTWDIEEQKMYYDVTQLGLDGAVYMQYTGVRDSAGHDIYEGDVVATTDEYYPFNKARIFVVKFEDGVYFMTNEDRTDGEYLFNESIVIDVMGNIYENKDLLLLKGVNL